MSSSFHPLVSIVIPVYNGANYLREAIDSALAQTYDNIEIIVVNDGSNDEGATEAIALSYGDKIRYFAKENGGVATALNFGIEKMQGEYFSWLSHDDAYLPEKVEKQIHFIEHFELFDEVVYCGYHLMDKDGEIIKSIPSADVQPENVYYELYLRGFINGCSLLIPRILFEKIGFFPVEYKTVQDYELWMRMTRRVCFVSQAEILIKSRQHAEQGSRVCTEHLTEVTDFYNRHLHPTLQHAEKQKYLGPKVLHKMLNDIYFLRMQQGQKKAALYALFYMCRMPRSLLTLLSSLTKRIFRKLGIYRYLPSSGKRNCGAVELQAAPAEQFVRNNFREIYHTDGFAGGGESASGGGSSLLLTRVLRRELSNVLQKYEIKTFLDAPCGDFNWMKHIDFKKIKYLGVDVVPELIVNNTNLYTSPQHSFQILDLLKGNIPTVDAIFCRDCLVHLPFEDIVSVLKNIKKSKSKYLITTTFNSRTNNKDLNEVWRPLNLCLEPFYLPEPLEYINEKCIEAGGLFGDKMLGIWLIDSIPEHYSKVIEAK